MVRRLVPGVMVVAARTRPAAVVSSAVAVSLAAGVLLAGALGPWPGAPARAVPATVAVTGGQVSGIPVEGTVEYLGIPFAAGGARFAPPGPGPSWPGVRSADRHGPACPQTAFLPVAAPPGTEDCLNIDVYVPARPTGEPLPVMVFFHGGGYTTGANSHYAPTAMVARGDVIVAVPNYRLGPLGFLSLPELAAESGGATGTTGIQDQQAALRWVRDNATAFGGDPDDVTIFGESAGGGSVCAHLGAPASAGLFHKAVVQSGSCVQSPVAPLTREESFTRSARFAERVGCGDPATRLACLRALPLTVLLDGAEVPVEESGAPTWLPGIDGVVLTRPLADALRESARPIPIIVGSNGNEGAQIVAEAEFARGRIPDAASVDGYVRRTFGGDADAVLAHYPIARYPSPAVAQSVIVTDGLFACPALATGRLARESGYPLWQYEFDQAPFGANPVLPGAFHAAELLYLFSSVLGVPLPWTGDSAVFAERMRRWWTDFAHTGDPNGHGSPRWPAWPRRDDPRADGPVLTMRAEGSAVSDDFAARHHCSFWDELSR
ncbi:MAG TPA: carboxylesterase family protein [Nocardia sp.]|uniref:carboxylesterase/lipase family protein n=1 Tax=Nocardia sp. TaxID=1821 RepID=UPI002B4B16D3|nr:carboxylesterase family protein [Nocardia sp.]HLS76148.1 carboxylesterase family protein [Nocardia sp.]